MPQIYVSNKLLGDIVRLTSRFRCGEASRTIRVCLMAMEHIQPLIKDDMGVRHICFHPNQNLSGCIECTLWKPVSPADTQSDLQSRSCSIVLDFDLGIVPRSGTFLPSAARSIDNIIRLSLELMICLEKQQPEGDIFMFSKPGGQSQIFIKVMPDYVAIV